MSGCIPLMAADLNLSTVEGETVTSLNCFAAAIGAMIGSYVADSLGRRMTTLLPGVLMVVGSLIMAGAQDFNVLITGRAMTGLAVGLGLCVYPVYVAELAPVNLRGKAGSYSELFWVSARNCARGTPAAHLPFHDHHGRAGAWCSRSQCRLSVWSTRCHGAS
jgi:MFS transporter, SP family, major inositol transporter